MEIISNIALITINETLVVQLVSFLVFLFVINRVMFKPLRGVMHERKEHVQELQSGIADAEKELEKLRRSLRKKEDSIRWEAFEMREKIEASGDEEASAIFASMRRDIAALKEKTEEEVAAQISAAGAHIRSESEKLAVALMEKVLSRRISI